MNEGNEGTRGPVFRDPATTFFRLRHRPRRMKDAWHQAKDRREGKVPGGRDAALDERQDAAAEGRGREWEREHAEADPRGEARVAQPHANARETEEGP